MKFRPGFSDLIHLGRWQGEEEEEGGDAKQGESGSLGPFLLPAARSPQLPEREQRKLGSKRTKPRKKKYLKPKEHQPKSNRTMKQGWP